VVRWDGWGSEEEGRKSAISVEVCVFGSGRQKSCVALRKEKKGKKKTARE
jgi:hypothetical protein